MSESEHDAVETEQDGPVSRRALITGLGTVAAGAGLAMLHASPAEAAVGDMFFGQVNDADTSATTLQSKATGYTLTVRNQAPASGSTNGALAVDADGGPGLNVVSTELAVSAFSSLGIGVRAQGAQAALYLVPKAGAGAPVAGMSHIRGEVVIDNLGRMFICATNGNPGVWVRPGLNPITPLRVADTRAGTGTPYSDGTKLGAGATEVISLTGVGGVPIPAGATAVALNVTATQPSAAGYLTLYPDGAGNPGTSSVNFNAGQTVANFAVVALGTNGKLRVFNAHGATHFILDVAGFYF